MNKLQIARDMIARVAGDLVLGAGLPDPGLPEFKIVGRRKIAETRHRLLDHVYALKAASDLIEQMQAEGER